MTFAGRGERPPTDAERLEGIATVPRQGRNGEGDAARRDHLNVARDLLDLIALNSRTPEERLGDIQAQFAPITSVSAG